MSTLLDKVIAHYLGSGDFNGFLLRTASPQTRASATRLLKADLIEVVSEKDWMNPHIRPWPTLRPKEDQLKDIAGSADDSLPICIYPTAKALGDRLDAKLFADQPYRRRQAKGGGRLELAYFRVDVLEAYRNDPRFHFDFSDFGVRMGICDDVYYDADEPEADKTSISHVGFAYDLSAYDRDDHTTPITRYVCSFLCDLGTLTAAHQQRWRTYEVAKTDGMDPHPVWVGSQIHGMWPDGLGAFARLMFELRTLNEFHKTAFGVDLLRSTEQPREFGWILRPSQQEFEAFIHQLDKLISENLRHEAFDKAGIPRKDDNDAPIGTLNRLDRLLARNGVPEDVRREVLQPIRDVRSARQKPAHALRTNVTDKTFIRKQAQLLKDVTGTLFHLREHWQSHPANAGWSEPDYVSSGKHYWI